MSRYTIASSKPKTPSNCAAPRRTIRGRCSSGLDGRRQPDLQRARQADRNDGRGSFCRGLRPLRRTSPGRNRQEGRRHDQPLESPGRPLSTGRGDELLAIGRMVEMYGDVGMVYRSGVQMIRDARSRPRRSTRCPPAKRPACGATPCSPPSPNPTQPVGRPNPPANLATGPTSRRRAAR